MSSGTGAARELALTCDVTRPSEVFEAWTRFVSLGAGDGTLQRAMRARSSFISES